MYTMSSPPINKPKIKIRLKPISEPISKPKPKLSLKKKDESKVVTYTKTPSVRKGRKKHTPTQDRKPFFSPNEKSDFVTIKTSLKSILRNYQIDQPRINMLVLECHQIITRTYQLLRLYLLHRYNQIRQQLEKDPSMSIPHSLFPPIIGGDGKPSTNINKELILHFIRAGGIRDVRGRRASNQSFVKELDNFYTKEYAPCLRKDKYDLKNKTYLITYLAQQIQTGYNNNIKVHFITRIRRLMNILDPFRDMEKDKVMKRTFGNVKNLILLDHLEELPEEYKSWGRMIKKEYLPNEYINCYGYDVKVYPEKYIYYMIKMNEKIVQLNSQTNQTDISVEEKRKHLFHLFQPIPLRTSIVPCYMTIDACAINSLFLPEKGRMERQKKIESIRADIWGAIFHTDRRVMKMKGYVFKTIQTDGIGASICFQKEGLQKKMGTSKKETTPETSETYLTDLSETELSICRTKKLVASDPGKEDLTHMMNDQKQRLRYGSRQRQVESQSVRNREILLIEKIRHHINEEETSLKDHSCCTIDYDQFKHYISLKTKLDEKVGGFYQQDLHRKMKWRACIDRRKSEDQFLNRIGQTYGSSEDILICHGNWSQTRQMKYLHPTLGNGLKRLLERRYKVVLVDEWGTSKYCNQCHNKLIHHRDSLTDKKLYRVLRCSECQSSGLDSKKTYFFNRDSNACMNILYLCHEWMDHRTRPHPYNRDRGICISPANQSTESDHSSTANGKL